MGNSIIYKCSIVIGNSVNNLRDYLGEKALNSIIVCSSSTDHLIFLPFFFAFQMNFFCFLCNKRKKKPLLIICITLYIYIYIYTILLHIVNYLKYLNSFHKLSAVNCCKLRHVAGAKHTLRIRAVNT